MSTRSITVQISADDRQLNEVLARALSNCRQFQSGASSAGAAAGAGFDKGRAAVALFNRELGLGMDRHLRAVLASCELLGPAFQVAFPVAVVAGFYVVIEKLVTHLKEMSGMELSTKIKGELVDLAKQAVEADRALQLIGKTDIQQAQLRAMWTAKDAGQLKEYMELREKQLKQLTDTSNVQKQITSYVRGVPIYGEVKPLTKAEYDMGPVVPSVKELREELAKLPLQLYLAEMEAKQMKATLHEAIGKQAITDTNQFVEALKQAQATTRELLEKQLAGPDKEIAAIERQITEWGKIKGERTGINVIANESIEKLQHELTIIKEQESASIRMALLKDKTAEKQLESALSTPHAQVTYTGSKEAMELYHIRMQDNDAIKIRDRLLEEFLPKQQKMAEIETVLKALEKETLITHQQYNIAIIQAKQKYDETTIAIQKMGAAIGDALKQGLLMGRSWQDVMKSLLVTITEVILKMTILKDLQNSSFGKSDFGSALTSIMGGFVGGFASGGVIPSGQWGIVGEAGPELAFGGASGLNIAPNGKFGGQVVYQDFRGAVVTDDLMRKADFARAAPVIENRAVNRAVLATQERMARS